MEINKCVNCMEDLNGTVCEKCGFDNKRNTQTVTGLQWNTLLKGRYLVGKILGQGGFGITYIGFDMLLNIKVALKEYFPLGQVSRDNSVSNQVMWTVTEYTKGQRENGCESFLKEARKMVKIDQIPEIVRVRDMFFENQTAYIIMDFIEGTTLKATLLESGTMKFSECRKLFQPLIESMAKVHKLGLIHRDISPDNIMIQPDGSPRILDLGAAKDMTTGNKANTQMVAKKGFSPAEQYMDSGVTGPWTDVYSMCATIYYCMSGKVIPDAMERLMQDRLSFDFPMKEPLPAGIEETLRAGLAVRSEERIQTMEELAARLFTNIPPEDTDTSKIKKTKEQRRQEAEAKKREKKEKKLGKKEAGKETTDISKKKWGKGKKIRIAIIALFLICFMRRCLGTEPVTIERLGNSNSNVLNDSGFHMIEDRCEYFIDGNANLYVCTYDAEAGGFHVDSGVQIVAEDTSYITPGQDKIYFVKWNEGYERDCIYQMNLDGSEAGIIPVIVAQGSVEDIALLQYAQMTNGEEYLYYMYNNTSVDRENGVDVYNVESGIARYNIEAEEVSNICKFDDTSLLWFNLYKDSVYYTKIEEDNIVLYRSSLDGSDTEAIIEEGNPICGFIEDEMIYLYSLNEDALIKYDLEGMKIGGLYNANMDTTCFTMAYVNDWIYYVSKDDLAIHRIRSNDTGDTVLSSEVYAMSICSSGNNSTLWIAEGVPEGDAMEYGRTYLASFDCSELIHVGKEKIYQTESGWQYWLSEEGAVICGCVSERIDVGIPDIVDGYQVCDIEEENMPEEYNYFRYAKEEDLAYEIEDGEVTVNGYNGELTRFMIPESIEGCQVVVVDFWYGKSQDMEAVVLPEGVKEIKQEAFAKCNNLMYVGLPESLQIIQNKAFKKCKQLKQIRLPDGIRWVGDDAFLYSGLEHIYISAGASGINGRSLYGSGSNCTAFEVEEGSTHYKAVDGVLYSADGKILIACPMGKQGVYTVEPGTTVIGEFAFAGCNELEKIVLADTVTEMKKSAVTYSDNLTEFVIPQSVKKIGDNVFYECENLTQITVSRDCEISENLGKELTVYYYE